MKNFKIVLIAFTLLLAVNNHASAQSTLPKTQTVVIQTSAICESCKTRIEGALNAMAGVKNSNLNLDDKKVTVVFSTKKTNVDAIKNLLSSIGYDADELKANPTAYENLPTCCKK